MQTIPPTSLCLRGRVHGETWPLSLEYVVIPMGTRGYRFIPLRVIHMLGPLNTSQRHHQLLSCRNWGCFSVGGSLAGWGLLRNPSSISRVVSKCGHHIACTPVTKTMKSRSHRVVVPSPLLRAGQGREWHWPHVASIFPNAIRPWHPTQIWLLHVYGMILGPSFGLWI